MIGTDLVPASTAYKYRIALAPVFPQHPPMLARVFIRLSRLNAEDVAKFQSLLLLGKQLFKPPVQFGFDFCVRARVSVKALNEQFCQSSAVFWRQGFFSHH
jgi:hypothetical protein